MLYARPHRAWITLLGGYPASVQWWDDREEGEIYMGESSFHTYIHEHTRKDAEAKAARIAPDVSRWLFID